jgi:hypothetical protein
LAKQSLALPHAQGETPLLMDKRPQRLAIPQIAGQAEIPGRLPQGSIDLRKLSLAQPPRTSGTLSLDEPRKPVIFKPAHPVGNGSGGIAKQFGDPVAAHALGDQQKAV